MKRAELHRLARLGAEDRLRTLYREIAHIHRAFPDLHDAAPTANPYSDSVRAAVAGVAPAVEGAVTRRPRRMSAGGRARIVAAAKRRWAAWRAEREDAGESTPGRARKKR